MEEGDLDIVEEEGGERGECGAKGEGIRGTKVHRRKEEGELLIDVL